MATRRSIATLLLVGTGCAWPSPERQLLLNFFQACRVYDTTVMTRLGTAACDPRLDGIVQDFEIASVEDIQSARPTKHVRIDARVRPLGGSPVAQTLEVTLQEIDGRWMVAALTRLPASQTSPARSSALRK